MRLSRAFALLSLSATSLVWVGGCASVDVTKTAKGFYEPTNAGDIEILMTVPDRKYVELGTVSTTGWTTGDTAKMHNALRAKTAPLGADAVILTDTGRDYNGYLWGNGVAIKFE